MSESNPQASTDPQPREHEHGRLAPLAVAALGVVFGDIGTSPLYALKECFTGPHAVAPDRMNVLGILSLIFWSITLVVAVKYLTFIMRADNHGEGGILALLALVPDKFRKTRPGALGWVAVLVLVGAALLYGDGIITPAISVLSAVEGLGVATTKLQPAVMPLTAAILFALFYIQRNGTEKVGRVFGPVMVLWFVSLGGLGIAHMVRRPEILLALSPSYAIGFFLEHGVHGIGILGAVVLTLTGGEALYADMGHFGRLPIRVAWYGLVMPSLLLNYFGQGALLLSDPSASAHPFFAQVPSGFWTYVLVAVSTAATIIASQALISGAYSLTRQAVQLGYFPRVTVQHTSRETEGQIYIPEINWALAAGCIALVLIFKDSNSLAAAYGLAVTGTMAITSIVFYVVVRYNWGWPQHKALPLLVLFLAMDLPFLFANLLKFLHGGYVPVVIGALVFVAMATWKRGRDFLAVTLASRTMPVDRFLDEVGQRCKLRMPGTSVFLTSSASAVPPILLHHLDHSHVLDENVVLLTVVTRHVPTVDSESRFEIRELGKGFWQVSAFFGFMERPEVPKVLEAALDSAGLMESQATYYIGRETYLATDKGQMGRWSEGLFSFLSRNARSPTTWFNIPPERVVELGVQLDL